VEEEVALLRKELGISMNDESINPALSCQRWSQRIFYGFGILVCSMIFFITPPSFSQTTGDISTTKGLVRGIDYYHQGKYDEALTELRSVVESNPHCPVAYYYAARIRLLKEQYPQTRRNLLAALEDSADYHDATGLLSYTNLKMGNKTDALIEWRRFVNAVDSTSGGESVTVESIMLPEQYREKLSNAKTDVKSTPSGVSTTKTDSISTRTVPVPSPALSAARTAGKPDSVSPGAGAEMALHDLDRRIQSEIRRGYYGIIAAAVLLIIGMGGIFFWIRRKRKPNPELVFSAEVSRFLDAREENEETALDEERIIREYEKKSHEISGTSHTSLPARTPLEPDVQIPETRAKKQIYPEETPLFPILSVPSPENNRQPITEEIKALVTRLYREGSSVVEIARISDLTKTEVELILAVRARRMEKLVEAASQDEDEVLDADHLYQAIGELRAEGNTVRDIARRLGISTSEVNLALSVMNRQREGIEAKMRRGAK
jgi:tetratricopeptide (TPR) repeat protein/lambda repressor-like predicted transcriptional regulator